ncbi:MAG TPA: sporulation protein YqfD [Clostridia bacterium]|nr:sporulation protein YqfD [Clostridia bacterium]
MLLRLWNYLRGYVIIIVDGFFTEKFINICAHRNILLWDVVVQGDRTMTMRMSIKGFRLIRPIARKAKCRVRLIKKTGIPFILNRYRRRKAFFVGALLFVALIYVLSSFIWNVEISGNKRLETARIEEALANNGIKSGILKYGIDTDSAVSNMMLDMEDISWISINIRGTKAKVQIRERIPVPEIVPRDEPCDIVASKDGMIKKVVAKEGIEAVGEGDTVKKGQVLIAGTIPLKDDDKRFRFVHAMGKVTARTWYEEESPVILTETERLKTGKEINAHSLVLFSWKLDLPHRKNNFSNYSAAENRRKLSIGEDLVFPLEWVTVSYKEEKLAEAVINAEDAKNAAAEAAYQKALQQVPENAKVVNTNIYYVKDEQRGLLARVTLECLEDIGVSRKIGGN